MGKTRKQYVYILEVRYPDGDYGISHEGWDNYEDAVKSILIRSDRPIKVGDYVFESPISHSRYILHPVGVRYDVEEMKELWG